MDKCLRMPSSVFIHIRTGELVSRVNNDAEAFPSVLLGLLGTAVSTVVAFALVMTAMLTLNWQVTIVAVVVTLTLAPLARRIGSRLEPLAREQARQESDLRAHFTERLVVSGDMHIRLNSTTAREVAVMEEKGNVLRVLATRVGTRGNLVFVIGGLVAGLMPALIYTIGGQLVVDDRLTVGTLVALSVYVTQLWGPLTNLPMLRVIASVQGVVLERVFELLDYQPGEPVGDAPAVSRSAVPGAVISLDQVWFRYPTASEAVLPSMRTAEASPVNDWVLRGVSLAVLPGQMLAVVGASGAGKSTIASLVAGLYEPAAGVVAFNGVDISGSDGELHRARIGMVTQDTFLFHDTVRANIEYARPGANESDIVQACRAAHIHDFLESLPEGYDTVVGEQGYRLSGGEKQRVGIARMILKGPEVLVLDEATAHLDSISERAVQEALFEVLEGRTSIVIAHRLSTIRRADQIAVLDDGLVVERGTHDQLMTVNGHYANLFRLSTATD